MQSMQIRDARAKFSALIGAPLGIAFNDPAEGLPG